MNRSNVFKLAWEFVRIHNFTKSEALKQAWKNYKLVKQMKKEIVCFMYKKADGNFRTAWGTLQDNIVPESNPALRKSLDSVQVYFDTEAYGWRSFRKELLVA